MLAKKTVKNQITLPKKIADGFPDIEYFDVRSEDGCIILKPLRMDQSDATSKKHKTLKISDKDIADAVGGKADVLVTGDKVLLVLNGQSPFEILIPAEFRKRL